MADVAKIVQAESVTFVARSARARPWMQQRFGVQCITYGGDPHGRELARALEAEALALEPPLRLAESEGDPTARLCPM